MRKIRKILSWMKPKPKEILCKCGHTSELEKTIMVDGQETTLRIKYKSGKQVPYCLDCIEKMTITCPWCGKSIFVGNYVTLYTPTEPNFEIPKGTVVYRKNPLQLVGCQRPGCAFSGADYCGIWRAPGIVKRIQSTIERELVTGGPVIVNFWEI